MGAAVGNIIATIMTTQITRNSGARGPKVSEPVVISSMLLSACVRRRIAQAAAASAKSKPNMTLR
jgi:hypothetical protein